MNKDLPRRTESGLMAEAVVRNVDIIFHIEGKGEVDDETKLPDYIFYKSLIDAHVNKSYVIKVEGGKTNVINLIEEIDRLPTSSGHIFFMDRDHDELLGLNIPKITTSKPKYFFYTHGYSFENDMWTTKMIIDILSRLLHAGLNLNGFIHNWKVLERKIAKIHKANMVSRYNGLNLFKLSGLCGIKFSINNHGALELDGSDVSRISTKLKGFGIKRSQKTSLILLKGKSAFFNHPGFLIQGHAYESYIFSAINAFCKQNQFIKTEEKPFSMYKNMALFNIQHDASHFLSTKTLTYYSSILSRL